MEHDTVAGGPPIDGKRRSKETQRHRRREKGRRARGRDIPIPTTLRIEIGGDDLRIEDDDVVGLGPRVVACLRDEGGVDVVDALQASVKHYVECTSYM